MARATSRPTPVSRPADRDAARADALAEFLRQMEKDRPGELLPLDSESVTYCEVVPTGIVSLDVALGVGGFPRGRIVELYGPEMSGKTTLALHVAARVQEAGGNVAFVDAEHALDVSLVEALGIDKSRFVLSQPDSAESGIEMVRSLVSSGVFDMVIVDSVAAMVPQREVDGEAGDQNMGLHARLMGKFMRQVAGPVKKSGTMLVLINQVRLNLQKYGAPAEATGGSAIKFFSSLRLEVKSNRSADRIMNGTEQVGAVCTVTVKKNKLARPFRSASYALIFGKGIDASASLVDACETAGVLVRPKGSSTFTEADTGEVIGRGRDNVVALVAADPDLAARLTAAVYDTLRSQPAPAPSDDREDDQMDDQMDGLLDGGEPYDVDDSEVERGFVLT